MNTVSVSTKTLSTLYLETVEFVIVSKTFTFHSGHYSLYHLSVPL